MIDTTHVTGPVSLAARPLATVGHILGILVTLLHPPSYRDKLLPTSALCPLYPLTFSLSFAFSDSPVSGGWVGMCSLQTRPRNLFPSPPFHKEYKEHQPALWTLITVGNVKQDPEECRLERFTPFTKSRLRLRVQKGLSVCICGWGKSRRAKRSQWQTGG